MDLVMHADKLSLQVKHFSPMCADFTISKWQHRRDAGKKQGLIQACKPKFGMRIIDATAGWGRDAAILASFGAQVLLLERNATMGALLNDALIRRDEHSKKVLSLQLMIIDALDYLKTLDLDQYPDLIYLDPMHPLRNKTALVKKNLQLLQSVVGQDLDAKQLLMLALTRTKHSVVVKWPRYAAPIYPSVRTIFEKTVRFDIYKNRSETITKMVNIRPLI